MLWILGAVALLVVGVTLRKLLGLDSQSKKAAPVGLARIGSARESLYQPIAREIETQTAILGISLNEAFEERQEGRGENAWHLVGLSASEWSRLAEVSTAILNLVDKYMPAAHVVAPVRNLATHRFKSRVMVEQVRIHQVLHQFVFRSKLRFQIQVRVLRSAVEALTQDFTGGYHAVPKPAECPAQMWSSFDLEFHDFDLLTKETLLAFRAFLTCLDESELQNFSSELAAALPQGVCSVSTSVPVER